MGLGCPINCKYPQQVILQARKPISRGNIPRRASSPRGPLAAALRGGSVTSRQGPPYRSGMNDNVKYYGVEKLASRCRTLCVLWLGSRRGSSWWSCSCLVVGGGGRTQLYRINLAAK